MNFSESIILSIVEGITEFLPISSTGHLILASDFLKIEQTDFVKSFQIFIQLGAICSVIFLYYKDIIGKKNLWKSVIAGFIPTAFVGLALYSFIKGFLLGNSGITLVALLLGGVLLIAVELFLSEKKSQIDDISKIDLKRAFGIGLIQSVSVIPGVSRSASSIVGGMMLGLSRKSATEFSFILAIPTMLAAVSLDLFKSDFSFNTHEIAILAVGFIASFFVALISVKFLVGYVRNHTFIPFGIYRIIIAILYFLLVF